MAADPDPNANRKAWMSLLAQAPAAELAALWAALGLSPAHHILRAPETGSVMVQGQAGAVGAAFNLGEMTVTRCAIRLECGAEGHAYVQGRDKVKALQVAVLDGLMQTDAAGAVQRNVLTPLAEGMKVAKATRAAKAAATKVDFFTMARGNAK
jgi:alpha-D-ribose 1-methylphosphonate 5-triphosphate synthase subunit PhnG